MVDFTIAHREEGFDKHIEQSIRGYSDLIQDVISLSRHFIEDNTNVVDIGCSTGKMTKALIDYNLDQCNNTKYIGLEIAEGFQGDLQKRKEEINEYYRNVRFEDSDARLYEYEIQKRDEQSQKEMNTKTDIGWGHQIRSYVLQPYQLVKDLRNKVENTNPSSVLDGNIDQFIEEGIKNR